MDIKKQKISLVTIYVILNIFIFINCTNYYDISYNLYNNLLLGSLFGGLLLGISFAIPIIAGILSGPGVGSIAGGLFSILIFTLLPRASSNIISKSSELATKVGFLFALPCKPFIGYYVGIFLIAILFTVTGYVAGVLCSKVNRNIASMAILIWVVFGLTYIALGISPYVDGPLQPDIFFADWAADWGLESSILMGPLLLFFIGQAISSIGITLLVVNRLRNKCYNKAEGRV